MGVNSLSTGRWTETLPGRSHSLPSRRRSSKSTPTSEISISSTKEVCASLYLVYFSDYSLYQFCYSLPPPRGPLAVITPDSPAAEGVSAEDMQRREKAFEEKKRKLKKPHMFIS